MTGDPATSYGVRVRKRLESTSSPLFFQAAGRWIDECATDHACSAYGDPDTECLFRHGPHRLIDLNAFGTGVDDVRVIHTMSSMEDLNYAALSYCWGRGMPADSKTKTQNIDKRGQRLEFLALPQTLKDAFTVSRGLKIQSLWRRTLHPSRLREGLEPGTFQNDGRLCEKSSDDCSTSQLGLHRWIPG